MAAIKYWLWLSASRVSPAAKAALAEHYGGADAAFFAPSGEFSQLPFLTGAEARLLEQRELSQAEEAERRCGELGIDIITLQDAAYPRRLKAIFAPPVVLYVKGCINDLDSEAAVAVIGTRSASPYGLKMGRDLAFQIVRSGGTVISMLTEGIDAEAARGALLGGGRCIGVLGSAHPEHISQLQRDVIASGALVSEYPPGTETRKHFFRERNRVAAGLSAAVAVVEAPDRSGALLFAEEALEQGREIFAVPGNADAPNSVGSNRLLKQGARPVTCAWDIMEELEPMFPGRLRRSGARNAPELREAPETAKPEGEEIRPRRHKKEIDKDKNSAYIGLREQLKGLNEEQLNIISTIGKDGKHIDDIIEATGYAAAKVLAQLTILEIKGYISRGSGKRIILNIRKK